MCESGTVNSGIRMEGELSGPISRRVDGNAGAAFKDTVLNELAIRANIAQFVSFGPSLEQRYSRVRGYGENHEFPSVEASVAAILERSPERSVNVRSFKPGFEKGAEFTYGLRSCDEATETLQRLSGNGFYTILNETVDVNDGGVSGVVYGGIIEWAPGDTPRCVERSGLAAMPDCMGIKVLETVYGFAPLVDFGPSARVEFSLHPIRRGFLHQHTIIWEVEPDISVDLKAPIEWPNRFSALIGDKVFGLLVADVFNFPVPRTIVVARKVAPFAFGRRTGSAETWMRTCPAERSPGRFTTTFGWSDPFEIMSREDPGGTGIAAVMAQDGIEPVYSGSLVTQASGGCLVEGVKGRGDNFMVSRRAPEMLPPEVHSRVVGLFEQVQSKLGSVSFEWVFDGHMVWIVQLHRERGVSYGKTIYPGDADSFVRFEMDQGIEALRSLISDVRDTGVGVIVVGNVGITSHAGDLLRRARIPSRIESA